MAYDRSAAHIFLAPNMAPAFILKSKAGQILGHEAIGPYLNLGSTMVQKTSNTSSISAVSSISLNAQKGVRHT